MQSYVALLNFCVKEGIVFPCFLDVYVGVTHLNTKTSVEVTYVTSEQKHRITKSKNFQIVASLSASVI